MTDYKSLYLSLFRQYGNATSEVILLSSILKQIVADKEIMERIPLPQRAALLSYFGSDVQFDDIEVTKNKNKEAVK